LVKNVLIKTNELDQEEAVATSQVIPTKENIKDIPTNK
jgi:hypothetical protein